MISPPNSSHIFQNFVPKIFDNVKKSIDAKMNNSIDVRKLQQNIDNWTIQVCIFNKYVFTQIKKIMAEPLNKR